MKYHAHIYWKNPVERKQAMAIREWLADNNFELGRVWDQAIGPHTEAMYQVIYDSSSKDLIEKFLKGSSALIRHSMACNCGV